MNDFDYDAMLKKRIANSANKRKRNRRGCRLEHDGLTEKQLQKLNGEVYSVNLKERITYEEFKCLPDGLAIEYYNNLVETYGVGYSRIAGMMGVRPNVLYLYLDRHFGDKIKRSGRKKPRAEQMQAWGEFLWRNREEERAPEDNKPDKEITDTASEVAEVSKPKNGSSLASWTFQFKDVKEWREIFKLVGNLPLPEGARVSIKVWEE